MNFSEFFRTATGNEPYGWQCRLAEDPSCESRLIDIPTGLGKTAGVVLAWLWNLLRSQSVTSKDRSQNATTWPRRLVYCLPMRTLVEQTEEEVEKWLRKVAQAASLCSDPEKNRQAACSTFQIPRVIVLMGGEDLSSETKDWDLYPERPAVLIGTQDMLLSRALNRGYGMSRYRWPMHFALLNNDALWVMDEVQLMGVGLASTTQLEGFRNDSPLKSNNCSSWWMSATIRPEWLKTVDFPPPVLESKPLCLTDSEKSDGGRIEALRDAPKSLTRSSISSGNKTEKAVADYIADHYSADYLNLVVVNTVKRARALHKALNSRLTKNSLQPILLHSQFRPTDRNKIIKAIYSAQPGQIVVTTQVIEAGVDISAHTLFTELAPWSSLVQRFGRCNRHLIDGKPQFADAQIHWFDLDCEKEALPYETAQLKAAKHRLEKLEGVSVAELEKVSSPDEDRPQFRHVVRRKDLIELFDTTPDLAGGDLDIDRFIRDTEASHVQVFWRNWAGENPNGNEHEGSEPEPTPHRDELCSVAKYEFGDFVKRLKSGNAWRWNALDRLWQTVRSDGIYPGQTYLLHSDQGGYEEGSKSDFPLGWNGDPKNKPRVAQAASLCSSVENNRQAARFASDAYDGDPASTLDEWQTLAEHTDYVSETLEKILEVLSNDLPALPDCFKASLNEVLQISSRWHDWGKAHSAFQAKLNEAIKSEHQCTLGSNSLSFIAKAPDFAWKKGRLPDKAKSEEKRRKHFRHELASALGILHPDAGFPLTGIARDLAAYLIAAHHGKVRLSIRSLPGEWIPPTKDEIPRTPRFARGVWDGDELPVADLGDGVQTAPVRLSLELIELGLGEEEPFVDEPSWAERALSLRDILGPFNLAYLETLLRAADGRASQT